eukprot:1160358-Pelagomonas_calceolata.AAC.13
MLAVGSGTMYRKYANVVRALLTDWCHEANRYLVWPLYTSAYVHASPTAARCTYCATTTQADYMLHYNLNKQTTPSLGRHSGSTSAASACPLLCYVHPTRGVKQGLDVYAKKKHIIINTVKSGVVHFNSKGNNLPIITIGSDTLAQKDSFKYLGMLFYRTLNMGKSAENAPYAMLISAYRIRRFVCEHTLVDRSHASLWLAKTCVIPAGMYGSQVWGTGFMQAGKDFSSALQPLHLNFLKGSLGVERTTTNWAVLRECGHHLLATTALQTKDDKRWTAQLMRVFQVLQNSENSEQAVRAGGAISMNDFSADLGTDCKEFGEKLSYWIPKFASWLWRETTISLLPAKIMCRMNNTFLSNAVIPMYVLFCLNMRFGANTLET